MLKKAVICIIISVGLFFSSIYVNFFCFNGIALPAEYWVAEIIHLKVKYAKSLANEPKVIVMAGSNSLFGFSTEIFQKEIGRPVLNLAVHASLPLTYKKSLILEYAKPGDIVIMPLEYSLYFDDGKLNLWVLNQYIAWGKNEKNFIDSRHFYEILGSLLRSLPSRYIDAIFHPKYLFREQPICSDNELNKLFNTAPAVFLTNETYNINSSGKFGEFFYRTTPNDYIKNKANEGITYIDQTTPNKYVMDQLVDLNHELRKRDVKLLLTYPVSIKNKDFSLKNNNHFKKLDQLVKNIEEHDLLFFGNPYLYNMPIDNFSDTEYHLNAKGNILRTLYLATDFNQFIKNNTSIRSESDIKKYANEIFLQYSKQ